jgi:hypothetical protein
MAKHQKPKAASLKGNQKNHNKATRGVNTRRRKFDVDYSELELDWVEEIAYYNALYDCKIYKEALDDETYEYRVRGPSGELKLTIVSSRNLNRSAFGIKKRRPKRRRR